MNTTTVTYPATPQNVDERVVQPSSAFKQEVIKVLASIFFFMLVYVALMAASIFLAILCGYGGLMLVIFLPKLITIMIGLGLVGLGGMVIFFLLKFLFKRNTTDRSHLIEITEADQPELFAFVRKLTSETQSPFPKKIYLSADVNACVFYDSGFWSMFLPVRKNLQIGLGLVNAVNVSEFKAILAHEFGHFSQRSMKLGSYVYNVNHVIYNMLYDNAGYGRTLEGWANISGYFAFFAAATVKIVQGIQWILQKVYAIVNKSYMSLSRQMEFHADSVAAYVSGSAHLVTSLRRLEVADMCYNRLFQHYNSWYKQNLKPDNLYPQHREVMMHFASEHGLPVTNGLPQVTAQSFANFKKTRVEVKDQWASHPSTDDREDHLNKLNIHTDAVHASAWVVFRNVEALQQEVTDKIYSTVTFQTPPAKLDMVSFRQRYTEENERYSLNKQYKGFFNARKITEFDPENENGLPAENASTLEDILTDQALSLPYQVDGLKADIQTLEAIDQGSTPVKSFEFNGEKYTRDDAAGLLNSLKEELKQTEKQLEDTDKRVIAFFLKKAGSNGQVTLLKERYKKMFTATNESEADIKRYIALQEAMQPIYYGELPIDKIENIMHVVKLQQVSVKERLQKFLEDPECIAFYSAEDKKKMEEFIAQEQKYFAYGTFLENEITLFNEALHLFQVISTDKSFALKKELLEWQLAISN